MSAERIDPALAVIDERIAALGRPENEAENSPRRRTRANLIEARATVAELIEQRDRYENALHLIASGNQRPGHVNAMTKARMAEIARAALAR